jgi:hypothetical protein
MASRKKWPTKSRKLKPLGKAPAKKKPSKTVVKFETWCRGEGKGVELLALAHPDRADVGSGLCPDCGLDVTIMKSARDGKWRVVKHHPMDRLG